MRKKRSLRDFRSVLFYSVLLLVFILFGSVGNFGGVLAISVFSSVLALGGSWFVTPVAFLFSFVVTGKSGMIASMAIASVFLIIVLLIYKGFDNKPKYELPLLTLLSLIGYVILGDILIPSDIIRQVVISVIAAILSLITFIAFKAIKNKGLKVKLRFEEKLSLTVCVTIMGLGLCYLTTPLIWKTISVFIILLSAFIFRAGITTVISSVFGISFALYYSNVSFVALFTLFGVIAESFTPFSRYVASAIVVASDYLLEIAFSIYGGYALIDFIFIFVGAFAFCIIPTKFISRLKEKLYIFREKQLERQSINRNRTMVSNRLYEISTVFTEMANAFVRFKKSAPSESSVTASIDKELKKQICADCRNFETCKRTFKNTSPFIALIGIGLAKGKVSFIDLPKELSQTCISPNDILYATNRMLADYKNTLIANMNLSSGRDLIAEQAVGVSEVLKGLALECGHLLKYQTRLERNLSSALSKCGLNVLELLIFGEGENTVVSVITDMKEIPIDKFNYTISSILGLNVRLTEKSVITDDKTFLSFSKSADFDAVFGLASATKQSSNISGDTHSVTRIPNDKFLIALSDGMGSGQNAEKVSSTSLALIESFYKAGLSSSLILKTVNKLLSVNTEDTFTALDISVIDLKTLSADFIKYGSPYGFILGDDGIKIIEGNSLPLGILEELKPSVCHTELHSGDMLVFMTDGISDAFGSSSEAIEFLRTLPAKNPQSLAEEILNKATSINDGKNLDDMTVLAVRVFDKFA